ncbi:MAG: PDZ domain-containing protein [Acidobacteria bacterium]|nr:PDZ domain-containing protein [Acidobacteriota bacterium]
MLLRILVVLFWILAALAPISAQTTRRKAQKPIPQKAPVSSSAKIPADDSDLSKPRLLQSDPKGWVYVSYTIDLARQHGGEENIYTLDGGPMSVNKMSRSTIGLVIDNEGHVVTRLVDVTPSNLPLSISVRASRSKLAPAKFLGMDTVTGLCVLKVEGLALPTPAFFNSPALPKQLNIRLYGFHPNLKQHTSVIVSMYPRLHFFPGQIIKAVEDFRYNTTNPIYYLRAPRMTAVQDCSLILNKDDSVFGMAIYNIGSEGKHLVYPVSRVQTIAQSVIKDEKSIAYGWLGATGSNVYATITNPIGPKQPPTEFGWRVLGIAPDSPAEKAGVKIGDIVLAVNDQKVDTYAQTGTLMKQLPPDCEVTIKVKRNKEYKILKARLVPAPAIEPEQQLLAFTTRLQGIEKELKILPASHPNRPNLEDRQEAWKKWVELIGTGAPKDVRLRVFYKFEIQTLTGQLMNYFAVNNGVLVSSVTENGKASRSGLQAGDIIIEVGGRSITNLETLIGALDAAGAEPFEITVSRRRERLKITF